MHSSGPTPGTVDGEQLLCASMYEQEALRRVLVRNL